MPDRDWVYALTNSDEQRQAIFLALAFLDQLPDTVQRDVVRKLAESLPRKGQPMAAKEPTVERRHREVTALALKTGTQFRASELEWIACGGGSVAPSWERVSQALAAAERASAERAWDEGAEAACRDNPVLANDPKLLGEHLRRLTNPYHLPKGPTNGR